MAIIYPQEQERTPIVAIFGDLPHKNRLRGIVRLFEMNGLDVSSDGSTKYVLDSFSGISERINDYLQIKKNPASSLDHFQISAKLAKHSDIKLRQQADEDPAPNSLRNLYSEFNDSCTCLNIISDSKTYDWQRLREYVLFWISTTGFSVRSESKYKDFNEFAINCEQILTKLQDLYENPLDSIFERKDISEFFYFKSIN